jgi:hypothetical protein
VDRLKLQFQVICCWHKHLLGPLYVIDSYDKTELCVSLCSEFKNNTLIWLSFARLEDAVEFYGRHRIGCVDLVFSKVPEGWHKASYALSTLTYQVSQYKIQSPWRPGTWYYAPLH